MPRPPRTIEANTVYHVLNRENARMQIFDSVIKGKPFGSESWIEKIAEKLKLKSTLNPRGRPKKGT